MVGPCHDISEKRAIAVNLRDMELRRPWMLRIDRKWYAKGKRGRKVGMIHVVVEAGDLRLSVEGPDLDFLAVKAHGRKQIGPEVKGNREEKQTLNEFPQIEQTAIL